jgi:dihydroorotase
MLTLERWIAGEGLGRDVALENVRVKETGWEPARVTFRRGLVESLVALGSGGRDAAAPADPSLVAVDGRGLHLLPGLVDAHVHFREPGDLEKGDWRSESLAALAGGVTTVLDMPNNRPPILSVASLEQKRAIARERSVVDFGLYIGASEGNFAEIERAENVAGVKLYLNQTTGDLRLTNRDAISKVLTTRHRVVVHAEGDTLKMIVDRCREVGRAWLYVAHTSSRRELAIVREARARGMTVHVEVAPHHLLLDRDDHERMGGFAAMKPPLQTKDDAAALWAAVADGTATTVATDHAPHTVAEKSCCGWPMGVPGVELMLPLLLTQVHRGRLSLDRVVELCCEAPSRVFRMDDRGRLAPGLVADAVLVDLGLERSVGDDAIHTKPHWSPYFRWWLTGWPVATLRRGQPVWPHGVERGPRASEVRFAE